MKIKLWSEVSALALMSVLAVAVAVGSGCGEDEAPSGEAGCSADSDCKGDRVCVSGQCQAPGGSNNTNNNTDDNNNTTNNNNNNTPDMSQPDAAYCCVNGQYFACPSQSAAEQCVFSFDESACSRDVSRDGACDDGDDNNNTNNDDNNNNNNNTPSKKEVGATCRLNEECAGEACLVRDEGDVAGYCSKRCESFSDCPTFWECEELGNAAGRYCVQD